MKTSFISAALVLAAAGAALAGSASVFEMSTAEDFNAGVLKGVAVFAPGGIRPGPALEKIELEQGAVWSLLAGKDGDLFAGTARKASVFRIRAKKAEKILETEGLLVSDMAQDAAGILYAAVVPGGEIHRITPGGDHAVIVAPAEYVWALDFDRAGNLLAATGPGGKLFRIDKGTSLVRELFKSDREKNLISLAVGRDGEIYCGSAENGILYRVMTDGRVEAVHDFTEKEVRALAVTPGGLLVGTNVPKKEFDQISFAGSLSDTLASEGWGSGGGRQDMLKKIAGAALYSIDAEGRVSELARFEETFLLDVALGADGRAFAATGDSGRVFSAGPDGLVSTVIDLEEDQVLSMAMGQGFPAAVGSGGDGHVFLVSDPKAPGGTYTSKVVDTKFPAVFGRVTFEGRGDISFSFRSGRTAEPDRTWSEWSAPFSSQGTPAPCPPGRFFQLKIEFGTDRDAELRSVKVVFCAQNQKPSVSELTVGETDQSDLYSLFKAAREASLKIKVKAEDPNGDLLVYRYYYMREGDSDWAEMAGSPTDKAELDWNTESLPDGLYRVKVTASDEAFNSQPLSAEKVSRPVHVDNHRPGVEGLHVAEGASPLVRGVAVDSGSLITRIDYQVDDLPFRSVAPADQVFDSSRESFSFSLADLARGRHRLKIRVFDAAGNSGVAAVEFQVP